MLPDFKLYDKDIIIKLCSIGTKTDTDHWNRIESPEINLHLYGQLVYEKVLKLYSEGWVSLIYGVEKAGQMQKTETGPLSGIIYIKNKLKMDQRLKYKMKPSKS